MTKTAPDGVRATNERRTLLLKQPRGRSKLLGKEDVEINEEHMDIDIVLVEPSSMTQEVRSTPVTRANASTKSRTKGSNLNVVTEIVEVTNVK